MRRVWRHATATSLCLLFTSPWALAEPARLVVDMTSLHAEPPRPLRVARGERVVVRIRKPVFHTCTVASKAEALPALPDPIAQILGILSALPGALTAFRLEAAPVTSAPARDLESLARQLDGLLHDVTDLNADLDDQIAQLCSRTVGLPEWIACDRTVTCSDPIAARARLDQLAAAIQRTPSQAIGSTAIATARTTELLKTLTTKVVPASEDGAWMEWAFSRIRVIQELIDTAVERRQIVIKGREALLTVRDRILAFAPSVTMDEPLSPQDNAKTVVSVACSDVVMQQPAIYAQAPDGSVTSERIPPVTAAIVYQDAPRATVSAGVLYSSVDGREIGVTAHSTGADAMGVVTYQRRVVESDRSSWQLLPFSFFNIMVPGLRTSQLSFAGSLGVGLNPNNGSTVVEYFAGGSIGLGRAVSVEVGAHFGTRQEPAEQFVVGDVVPDRLVTVPTTRVRATALGVALSYAIPLPR
jgi:hypothetical protein